ncbi:hypothetical protein PR202_gb26423 [Eleusine coracana subsp. coracana]|uniref:Uncharacterized protein n=1 Tax=Eleusine coracana subsp. coracana TaxID=191504 RepID=A0AAV5FSJ3_ELECO|nr:hypothetical protein PR202_gb26423 [Eleusine coracana subsp. coracana]
MAMRSLSLLLMMMLSASMYVSTFMAADVDDEAALLSFKAVAISSGHQRVVALTLPSHGLTGVLSPAIGNLSSLRTLNLSFNGFSGDIPASLSRLRRLHILDLSHNTFSSEVPVTNKLTGAIPTSLGNLSSLVTLELAYNQLEGTIPSSLGNILGIRYLALAYNNLSDNSSIAHFLPSYHSKQHGNSPGELAAAAIGRGRRSQRQGRHCQQQRIQRCSCFVERHYRRILQLGRGDMRRQALRLPSYRFLSLNNNSFTDAIPVSLGNLSSQNFLDLCFNQLDGTISTELGAIKDLRFLGTCLQQPLC